MSRETRSAGKKAPKNSLKSASEAQRSIKKALDEAGGRSLAKRQKIMGAVLALSSPLHRNPVIF
jgi:hypothetical protein